MTSLLTRVINDLSGTSGEALRQQAERDSAYTDQALYYLELRLAPFYESYFFPFAVPPQAVTFSEQFAVAATPTQGSGLYVEEDGIIMRRITMQGTTGLRPRPLPGAAPIAVASANRTLQGEVDWLRELPSAVLTAVSGQRHLQYLQDAVLRVYSAYKKHPKYAKDTDLVWHSVRDDEHWLVAPEQFEVSQSIASPMTYRYNLTFLVKAADEGRTWRPPSPDKSFLDKAHDFARSVQASIDRVNGALLDLTAFTGELTSVIKDYGSIVGSVGNIFLNASRLVAGVDKFISSPFAVVLAAFEAIDNLLYLEYSLKQLGKFAGYPDVVRQRFLSLQVSLAELGQHPEVFTTSAQQRLRDFYAAQQNDGTQNVVTAGSTRLRSLSTLGTANLPGQAAINRADLVDNGDLPQFTGSHTYTVGQGDTLHSIAVRQMGDASLWRFLAEYNSLRPPFVAAQPAPAKVRASDDAFPTGILTIGQTLVVPDYSTAPENLPNTPLLGVHPDEPPEVHLFGRDLLLSYSAGGSGGQLMDLVIDEAHGSQDFLTVSGIDNLRQAIRTQVATEFGTDVLFPGVGLQSIVGTGISAVDLQAIILRVRQAVVADARVASVQSVRLSQDGNGASAQADKLNIAVEFTPLGLTAPSRLVLSV